MNVSIRPFTKDDLPTYYEWAECPHVKSTWFQPGYAPVNAIENKIPTNGYDYPYIIALDNVPVGFIQYCDLTAYRALSQKPKDVFPEIVKGAFCFDIFIGETNLLGKGIGSLAVQKLCDLLFAKGAQRILIDPSKENHRAINFYKRLGFYKIGEKHDGMNMCIILEKKAT